MSSTYPDIPSEEQQENRGKTFLYFVFTYLLLYFFTGSGCSWGLKNIYANSLAVLFLLILYFRDSSDFKFSKSKFFVSISFIAAFLFSYSRSCNLNGYVNMLFFFTAITLIIMLNIDNTKKLLVFLTKWLAIALCISYGYYLLNKIGIALPYTIYIPDETLAENGSMYVFKNYYLFMEFYYDYFDIATIPRFQAFFTEPAYLGTICLLMIIANDFNFKNHYVKILFGMLLLSVSLASYLIFLYAFLLHTILCKHKWRYLCFSVLAAVVCFTVYFSLPEENVIDVYIVDRLFENGEFELKSNRTTVDFENYFWDTFVETEKLFWGGDLKGIQIAADTKSVDYKFFLVHYGILGAIFYSGFLAVLFFQYCSRRTFILLSSFGAIMFQSSFVGQYFTYLIPILFGVFVLNEKKQNGDTAHDF